MLKKRIVATILVRDGIVVQSIGFGRYLPVGKPEIALNFFDDWGADEIILLDISATIKNRGPDMGLVDRVAKKCRVPLAIGGGINSSTIARELICRGADKLVLNQVCLKTPAILTDLADIFGSQCVVASIDAVKSSKGYKVYSYIDGNSLHDLPDSLASNYQELGAGEILINSVNRDGSYLGFDLDLINLILSAVTVPVICSGGAGTPHHFLEVFRDTKVHAAGAANMLHFTEHSIATVKAILSRNGIPSRLDCRAKYSHNSFDEFGRLTKTSDEILEKLCFSKIEKEII